MAGVKFVHPGVPERIIWFTGVIALECACLDFLVSLVDGHMRGLSNADITTNILPEDTRKKTERCLENVQDTELKSALEEVPKILALRNVYLHSLAVRGEPTAMTGDSTLSMVFRGKHRQDPPKRTEENLAALRDKIGRVNAILFKSVGPHLPEVEPKPSA